MKYFVALFVVAVLVQATFANVDGMVFQHNKLLFDLEAISD